MNFAKVISTLVFALIMTSVDAQIERLVQNSTLIVEAEVLSKESYWNNEKTRIYTKNIVQVNSLFKGDIESTLLEIITLGGVVDDIFQFQMHTEELHVNQKGYFFLDLDSEGNYELVDQAIGFIDLNHDLNPKVNVFQKVFPFKKFEELIISHTKKPKLLTNIIGLFKYSTSPDPCNNPTINSNPRSIEITFENIRFTPDFEYLEFEVMAQVNTPGLKFGRGNLIINYSDEFGSNIITEETVEINRGDILQGNAYNLVVQDLGKQSLILSTSSDFNFGSPYIFSQSPASLAAVRIKVQEISNIGNISFEDIAISGNIYFWCDEAYQPFDEIILDSPINNANNQSIVDIGITYTFENGGYKANTNKFEVDLFAEATASSKYSDAFIYIKYNELGFGSEVIDNGTFTFTQDDLLADDNIYTVFLSDNTSSEIQLVVFSDAGANPNDLAVLSTDPRKLGTLSFEVLDCEEKKEISFNPITETSDHTHYTGAMPIPWELYTPVIAVDEETGKICGCNNPVITSFSPQIIPAGAGEILTIQGENFGNFSQSNSKLFFKNGDDGGSSWMRAHPVGDFFWNNVIHWSDNEIQVKVPSVDAENDVIKPAASGKFKIENTCGDVESDEILEIPYSLMNLRNGTFADKIALKQINSNGICITYNNNLPEWIRIEFKAALESWCPHTEISFYINEDESLQNFSSALDGVNLIVEEEVSSANGAAELVFTGSTTDCNNGTEEGSVLFDLDIKIDPMWTQMGFPTDLDKTRMRNNLKHELGHAHMLNHAIIPGVFQASNQSIVFYSFTTTSIGSTEVSIKPNDIIGANKVFENSANIISGSCGIPIGKSASCGAQCNETNSTSDEFTINNIIAFPNPTDGNLTLTSEDYIFEKNSLFQIVNNLGQVVLEQKVLNNSDQVDFKIALDSGVYFLNYMHLKNSFTLKIIVQ